MREREREIGSEKESERTRISDIRKNNILIIAWYEQNCDILLYNSAEKMREKYEEKSLRRIYYYVRKRERKKERKQECQREKARE